MVVILGAGLTGLTAAYELSKRSIQVTLVEKENELGGALSSIRRKGYCIERFYHHCFAGDKNFRNLISELGLKRKLRWLPATTAFYDGEFHNLSGVLDIFNFSPLSARERIMLGKMMLKIKLMPLQMARALDNIAAKDWVIRNASQGTWKNFFEPMLVSKFGGEASRVSAAWFIERMKARANRGLTKEKLGYVEGGFCNLIDELERRILANGGKIIKSAEASSLDISRNSVSGIRIGSKKISDNCVISTIPPGELLGIAKLPRKLSSQLGKLEYQGCVSVILGLKNRLTDFYWTNLIGKQRSFGALIEHTNFMPPVLYSGEHIIYLASYPPAGSKIWKMSKVQIARIYLRDLKEMIPKADIEVLWHEVSMLRSAGLVYKKGVLDNIPDVHTPVGGLFIGGMFNSFPERSMEASAKAGKDCAKAAEEFLCSH